MEHFFLEVLCNEDNSASGWFSDYTGNMGVRMSSKSLVKILTPSGDSQFGSSTECATF